ncbi:MAG: monovalent cation/H(+) antiporter subunit G [Oscillospiraceae bacterium]|nr:monovalent cation/H(+) antiporter subunit G [Oscillospiraceae bacterium]
MNVFEIIGNIFIIAGVIFTLFGVAGFFRFQNFYIRILVSSKVDAVGMLTLVVGLAFRHGISFFSGKLMLIIVVLLILNPLVSHIVARSAYLSGHEVNDPPEQS